MGPEPRQDIGATLCGDVLEIGPGHRPFPTAAGARVLFADRSVTHGRDATWPELAGQPWGPAADFDVNLDVDGLVAIADEQFDVVIACHVIEHLANPLAALREFERILRPGGRLVLVVPDRTRTFDSVREPTPFAHLIDEFDRNVSEVDSAHIREFCEAIYSQPPMHPEGVREWHDPTRLDGERLELHRRRSIHVHCWAPEEFAVAIAGALARGVMSWRLSDLYFAEDVRDRSEIEFGLVLERPHVSMLPEDGCHAFVGDWVTRVRAGADRNRDKVPALQDVVQKELAGRQYGQSALKVVAGAITEALGRAGDETAGPGDPVSAKQAGEAPSVEARYAQRLPEPAGGGERGAMGINYERLYDYRFRDVDQARRQLVWREIALFVFELMGRPQRVLDPAAGRGEFINAVPASERWSVDAVDHGKDRDPAIKVFIDDARHVQLPADYFDGIFVSNLLEHLDSQDSVAEFLTKMHASSEVGGTIAVMGPNFRYCVREYFDCADHILALTHVSVAEHLHAAGFEVKSITPRFLPYSFRGLLPPSPVLTHRYLRTPLLWRLLGKQFLVLAEKSGL